MESYINSVNNGSALTPPYICIEMFFNNSIDPEFEGNYNSEKDSYE